MHFPTRLLVLIRRAGLLLLPPLLGAWPALAGGARPGDDAVLFGPLWVLPLLATLLSLLARNRLVLLLALGLSGLNLVLAFLLGALIGFGPTMAQARFLLPVALSIILACRSAGRLLTDE